jgi:hypothetical protein
VLIPEPANTLEPESPGQRKLRRDRPTLLSRDQILLENRLDLLKVLDYPLPKTSRMVWFSNPDKLVAD